MFSTFEGCVYQFNGLMRDSVFFFFIIEVKLFYRRWKIKYRHLYIFERRLTMVFCQIIIVEDDNDDDVTTRLACVL